MELWNFNLSPLSEVRGQKDLKALLNPGRQPHLVCFPQSLLPLSAFNHTGFWIDDPTFLVLFLI